MDRVPDIFKEYIAMWTNYVNFNDRTTVRGYWMAVLWNVVAAMIVGLIGGIFHTTALSYLYSLAILVPGIAITVRRLKDMGKPWQYILFALIPLVGAILLIVWCCKPSVPDDGTPVV